MKWLLPPPAAVEVAEVVLMVAALAEVAVLAGPGLGWGREGRGLS